MQIARVLPVLTVNSHLLYIRFQFLGWGLVLIIYRNVLENIFRILMPAVISNA